MTATCTGCQQPLDLTQPHVKLVRQVEREQPGSVFVDDSVVIGQWHADHAPAELVPLKDALALIDDLLRPWTTGRPAHPGRPAVQAGMEDVEQVQRWQATRDRLRGGSRG